MNETIIELQTGNSLRCPAHPAECSYVRIVGPSGEELLYWDAQEWAEEPEPVMGAIVGALTQTADEIRTLMRHPRP